MKLSNSQTYPDTKNQTKKSIKEKVIVNIPMNIDVKMISKFSHSGMCDSVAP